MTDAKKKDMSKTEVILKFSIEDINIILDALSEKPFKEVYDVIGKINFQTNEQMKTN